MKQTFNKEFNNMLMVCIFIPFLHDETPKTKNVPKSKNTSKDSMVPNVDDINNIIHLREKV